MTLHDLNLAIRYCDQVYLMAQGKIVAEGTPTAVLTQENLIKHYWVDAQFVGNALSITGPISQTA